MTALSSCNTSTYYTESTSVLSFPISEFSTSNPLVQKIKKLWSLIFEGNLLKFNQQRCLRILQRIYSIHLSVEEIKENIGHGVYHQETLYDFEEVIESLNDLLQQIESFIEYNKKQWIIRRLLNSTYINYQFENWKNRVKSILEDFSYHYAKYSPNRNFDNVLIAWEEQDQIDLTNDEQNLIEKLEKTWKEMVKASKDSHGISVQQQKVLNILEISRSNIKEVITGLQRLIFCPDLSRPERITYSFAKITLEIIQKMFRYRIQPFPWAVTSWEIIDIQSDVNTKIDEFTDNCSIFDQYKVAYFREHQTVTITNFKKSALKVDFINNLIIWSNMQHKNVLPLLGANLAIPQPYIVNPFLSNGNMIGYLNEFPNKALNILSEVSDAMIYLHTNNIIHGDLKGLNVLVDQEGTVKVTNFGFYCIPYIRSTLDFSPKTYPWSAPELTGDALPTPQSDIYAFGILCYEAFYEGETYEKSYIDFLLSHLPQNISTAPKEMWELMQECWQTDPNLRPPFDKSKNIISHLLSEISSDSSKDSIEVSNVEDEEELNIMNVKAVTTTSYIGTLENGDNVFVKNYPWICLQHRKTRSNSNAFKPKIVKELQNLQKIQHPNVLPLKDYRIHDGYFSTVSSLISSGNVMDYIKMNEVDLVQRVNLIRDICKGLLFLHQHGIVHGDLRGNHVLVDENKHVKLTEYGIAQVQANVNKNFLSNSNSSVVINYNCWTAPELFIRNEIPTFESDVYSFGMLCYEILYGGQPFEYRDILELKENVCIYKIRPQRSKLSISCPDWLWNLMTECWSTESKERKSLEEVMKILNNPPPMEENIDNTLLTFANMKRSQSFLSKSLRVNSLISKLNKHKIFRSSSRISEIAEENDNKTNDQELKPLSESEANLPIEKMEKRSVSDSSISTMSSGELETYIQSIQKNSVTALLSDSDLATLKYKSYDDEEEIDKNELERINKKKNRKSLSVRLSSFRNASSPIYNVDVYSSSSSDNGKSYTISNDRQKGKKHRNSTMRKWSRSPEIFLSMARKSFRKDSSNVQDLNGKHEKKIIQELPTVEEPAIVEPSIEEPATIYEEKITIKEQEESNYNEVNTNKVKELTNDEQEVQTIANSQEELTEREKSLESYPIDNNVNKKNNIKSLKEKDYTKSYPSPKNSVHVI
ncbi:kinase-like protein [Neocallimastix sp. 'constans']|jgi:serine/threonine protein kinase